MILFLFFFFDDELLWYVANAPVFTTAYVHVMYTRFVRGTKRQSPKKHNTHTNAYRDSHIKYSGVNTSL